MYRSLCFKPKSGFLGLNYERFILEFIEKFNLKILKRENDMFIVENDEMMAKCERGFISVLVNDEANLLTKESQILFL